MSPWTALGWIVVALIVVPIALRVVIGLVELVGALVSDLRKQSRLRRAHKGRVECEMPDCANVATRQGAGGFACEDHIGTGLTRRGSVSYAFRLDHTKESE